MKRCTRCVLALAGLCLMSVTPMTALADGPDVIVGDLPNMQYFATQNGKAAYSIATTSCNIGNAQLFWIQSNNNHPVIAQNLYQIRNGRFRQIGQSWLKHGFCALQEGVCGACQPAGSGCVQRLGVGCSDPYSSSLNGTQSNLGPRSQVNPWTGEFPYPFTAPAATTPLHRRLVVDLADLPPQTPSAGTVYLMEGQYVTRDDALAGNQNNNASYRRIAFNNPTSFGTVGQTQRQKPAILGWKDFDPNVVIAVVDVPGEGRFYVGGNAVDNGDGTYTYNYAVYNMNSHIAARSFSVPMPCGVTATDINFSHAPSHSGEPYSNDPWTATVRSADALVWETETMEQNPNANAIRWGTAYTFWFTTTAAPAAGDVQIGLFRQPGGTLVATGMPVPGANCRADWDGNGGVNSNDISAFLADWLTSVQEGTLEADQNCDGSVNSNDISSYLSSWLNAVSGAGC